MVHYPGPRMHVHARVTRDYYLFVFCDYLAPPGTAAGLPGGLLGGIFHYQYH